MRRTLELNGLHICGSRQHLSFCRFVIFAGVSLVIYNEFLCYVFIAWQWHSPHLTYRDGNPQLDELRILFVADPQLVGLRDESPVFGCITRWDSDRFLRLGFWQALGFVHPDVVIFLGDLLDEGSSGSEDEYVTYVNRFFAVFKTPPHVQSIFISGDNDVGGEGFDRKEQWKINRFRQYFNNSFADDIATVKFIDFFKVSLDFGDDFKQSESEKWAGVRRHSSTAKFRVILNHMTLSHNPSSYYEVVKVIDPHIIVSAHSHLGRLYKCRNCRSVSVSPNWKQGVMPWNGEVQDLTFHDRIDIELIDLSQLHELAVPTCSYRMGVPNMGFGAAVINTDGRMSFTVLWLPSRYHQLTSYAIFVAILLLLILIHICSNVSKCRH